MQETRVRSLVGKIPWSREWQPTLVFLPGESHGQRSWWAIVPQGHRVEHDWATNIQFSWVEFSRSVMSDSLPPHGLQHARSPCPSPTPRAYSNLHALSQWCHPTICCPLLFLSSIFPSIRVFSNESILHIRLPSIRVSASASALPMNIQDEWHGEFKMVEWHHWLDGQEFE